MASKTGLPDGGFGWVVVMASFSAHAMLYGVAWSVGVFYEVFLEQFGAGKGATALISSLNTAVFYAAGPVSSILTNKFGCRWVAICGAVLGSAGLVTSMFATNIYHLYCTFGVLTGFGYGVAYIPAIVIVGHYFDNKRSLATGIAVSGSGVGTFIYSPLIRYLQTEFGWQGMLLIIGALNLNLCVCAALFRPLNLTELCRPESEPCDQNDNELTIEKINVPTKKLKEMKNIFNVDILKNWRYVMLGWNNFFICFGLSVVYGHLSAYAASCGLDKYRSASLVSAIGLANFLGRLLLGVVGMYKGVSAVGIYTICFFISGIVIELKAVTDEYAFLMALAVAFGFFSAALGVFLPQIIIEYLDVKLLSSGYGYMLVFEAIGTLLGSPVAGSLYDTVRMYEASFYLGGACVIISSFIMLVPWWHERRKGKKVELVTDLVEIDEGNTLLESIVTTV